MTIQQKIKETITQLTQLERSEQHLREIEKQIKDTHQLLDHLHDLLEKEYQDVEELEKLNARSLFFKVLGSKEEQLEKEKQEYLHAVLKYNECKKSLALIEFEKKIIKDKLTKLPELQSQLKGLLVARERELLKSKTSEGLRIKQLYEQIDERYKTKREVHEAIIAGAKASDELKKMAIYLSQSEDWGDWAPIGLDVPKLRFKSNIDKAQNLAFKAKRFLQIFEKELRDVYKDELLPVAFDLNSFNKFANNFFENLIVDWVIQQKIMHALAVVRSTDAQVKRLIGTLKHELKSLDQSVEYLEKCQEEVLRGE